MKIKNENAVTIVALVITVILMLILVGVVLQFSIGENGLIKVSKEAAKKYQNAANDEAISLIGYENEINKYATASKEIEKEDLNKLTEEDLNSMFYPNKSMKLSLSNNQITIPRNGWLYIRFLKETQGGIVAAYRNNAEVFYVTCPTINCGGSTYIPIKKGDIIKVNRNSECFSLRLDYYEKE